VSRKQSFWAFSAVLPVCYARAASGERLSETDELPSEDGDRVALNDHATFQNVRLKDVSFSYGRDVVLDGASALLCAGETVCITGASGSGKSTLFKLILNVYQCNGGEISVCFKDGENEREEEISVAHRDLFAYVPQGNFLFSGTIRENLTFFSPNCGKEEMERALQAACAEFVFELPEKLDTPLKERGGGLSEGQLQRLAIARAIISDRSVLLLDEATSALDSDTEKKVLENIAAMTNKTCLIVTHRPAALAIADRIWHVKAGKVEEKKA